MRFLLLLFCGLLTGLSGVALEVQLTPAARELNVDSFEVVWKTVRDTHWDPKIGGVDWQSVHDELLPKVEQAATMNEARAVMTDMLSRLHETHFAIVPSELYTDIEGPAEKRGAGKTASQADASKTADEGSHGDAVPGIEIRVQSGQAMVTRVDAGSSAAAAGVAPGWLIQSIDGEELAPLVRRVSQKYGDSTLRPLILARTVSGRLEGKLGSNVKIVFLDGAGLLRKVNLERKTPPGVPATFGFLPKTYVSFETRQITQASTMDGLIAFNAFLDPARLMPAFGDAVASCAACDGMILDLRGNPGGLAIMSMGMAGYFIEKPDQRLGTMYMRQLPIKFVINPREPHFARPLAILVDGLSASTSEIFAGGLRDLGRARIFGSHTAGAALPSAIEKLPNGDGFQHAFANYISQGGKPLEGAGLEPDVEAAPTRAALLAGHDPALDAAISWISQQKQRSEP